MIEVDNRTAGHVVLRSVGPFSRRVDQWVHEAIDDGVTTFEQLLVALPGVYPAVALAAMRRLIRSGEIQPFVLEQALADVGRPTLSTSNQNYRRAPLPWPHPLDYDWRFAPAASAYLLVESARLADARQSRALIGAPSVLWEARQQSNSHPLFLLDRNPSVLESLAAKTLVDDRLFTCDISKDPLPDLSVSVVVLDPPWYDAETRAFLWAASRLCQVGGHVLMSMPPIGTRAGIERDRSATIEWARAVGLVLQRIQAATLPYVSPLFERNALAAEHLYTIPAEWRRGDLAVFRRNDALLPPRPSGPLLQESVWIEASVDRVRFRIKSGEADTDTVGSPSLLPIITGDILPSVSRRDLRREMVDVWTSGNRIFHCQDPHAFSRIVRAISEGCETDAAIAASLGRRLTKMETAAVTQAARQVRRIVVREREEAARIGEEQ